MAKNTGKEYENFVKTIQETILNLSNSDLLPTKYITVELNKILIDRNGIPREFDLYWEFEHGGYKYCSVIECKDYASKVSIEKIDAFLGKTADIPGLRLIYTTKTGYQTGAEIKAKQHNIDLLVVRKYNDEDFITKNGIPLIRQVEINITIKHPLEITSFTFHPDISWLALQSHLDIKEIKEKFDQRMLNEASLILDKTKGTQLSLNDFADNLTEKISNVKSKEGFYSEELDNSYIKFTNDNLELKLRGYHLTYIWKEPTKQKFNINLGEQILGIIKNYITNEEKIIFKNGNVKNLV